MKFQKNDHYTTIAIYVFLVLAAASVFFVMVWNFSSVWHWVTKIVHLLLPFIYGFAIAFILNPALRWLEAKPFSKLKNGRVKRGLSLLLVYLSLLGLVVVFFWVLIPQIKDSIISLTSPVGNYVGRFDTWVRSIIASYPQWDLPKEVTDALGLMVSNFIGWLKNIPPMLVLYTSAVTSGVIRLTSGMLQFFIGIIISIYMLMGKERFAAQSKKMLYAFFPSKTAEGMIDLAGDSHQIFNGFIAGQLLDSAIVGFLCFLFMSIFNMPFAVLIGLIIGVSNIVPYFGPVIGDILCIMIILIESPVDALWFTIFVIALQQFDGNIMGPRIVGEKTGLAAMWAMFAILLFGGLWGFVGTVIGIPLFAVIYSVIRALADRKLRKKDKPTDVSAYAAKGHALLGYKDDDK